MESHANVKDCFVCSYQTDKHECSHDWKTDGAEEIARTNPEVNGEKASKYNYVILYWYVCLKK